MKKRPRLRHAMRFATGIDGQTLSVLIPVSPARHKVQIPRTVKDVLQGKRGQGLSCADALCSIKNQSAFPHPVIVAEFGPHFAYIVDKVDRRGHPTHCIKYRHDDGKFIAQFDKPGGKSKLIKSGEAERVITLNPPYASQERPRPGRPRGKNDGSRSRRKVPFGATKRAVDAGLQLSIGTR